MKRLYYQLINANDGLPRIWLVAAGILVIFAGVYNIWMLTGSDWWNTVLWQTEIWAPLVVGLTALLVWGVPHVLFYIRIVRRTKKTLATRALHKIIHK